MKLLSAAQMRDWDTYTIDQEPIASIDLMERAALAVIDWLETNNFTRRSFAIFCGPGNNGGDGLAIARLLIDKDCEVVTYVLGSNKYSKDFTINLERLTSISTISVINSEPDLPTVSPSHVIIDCLFGTGLNKIVTGIAAQLISHINALPNTVVAIDMPSGLFANESSFENQCIQATHTLTFQAPKLALLLPENSRFTGNLHVLNIGLNEAFAETLQTRFELIDLNFASGIYRPSNPFAHKGNHGHSLLIAGSYGKMGAAVMAANACLRAGTGLLTCYVPSCGYQILQTSVPEAMAIADHGEHILTTLPDDLARYNVVGIGPGVGIAHETARLLRELLLKYRYPILLDADALNILAEHPDLLLQLPPNSVLTPHPKEFERLFGKSNNDLHRLDLALEQAEKLKCIIILKGHHTFIALPDGKGYFNTTGNAGMAKGGSGDVLSGMITALIARTYQPAEAAILGVFLHGLAGDLAAEVHSEESMLPTDTILQIGYAYKQLANAKIRNE